MEYRETLSSGVQDGNLDLTLRLCLPFQGIQKQENFYPSGTENHETLTLGVQGDKLDLTLRLGLPFQGIQKQENAKENWLKQGEVDLSLKLFVANEGSSTANSNVQERAKSPSILHENSDTPDRITLGSNNISSSKETPKKCSDCGSDDTPLWRKGPSGAQTLCNACGLRYARFMKRVV